MFTHGAYKITQVVADAMMDNGCEDSHWMHGVLCLGKACFFSQWIKESVSDKT